LVIPEKPPELILLPVSLFYNTPEGGITMSMKKMGARHFVYPQPAALVGANVDGKPNYLVVAWCGVMQATPPLVYVSIRKERHTLPGIRENGTFSLCIPSCDLVDRTDYCGIKSGADTDKSGVFSNFYGETGTAPMIEECPVCMECKVTREIDFEGTHIVFVGEIIESYVNEDVLDGSKPDPLKVDPMIFSTDGNYWSLGENKGRAYRSGLDYNPGK